eukprot:6920409-Prymnesium_polylepis.1
MHTGTRHAHAQGSTHAHRQQARRDKGARTRTREHARAQGSTHAHKGARMRTLLGGWGARSVERGSRQDTARLTALCVALL